MPDFPGDAKSAKVSPKNSAVSSPGPQEKDSRLLVAKRFDRVQTGGFPGRPHAEDQTNRDRDGESGNDGPQGNACRQTGEQGPNKITRPDGEKDSEYPAHARERHGLEEELEHDVPLGGPNGFAHADFPGPFRH